MVNHHEGTLLIICSCHLPARALAFTQGVGTLEDTVTAHALKYRVWKGEMLFSNFLVVVRDDRAYQIPADSNKAMATARRTFPLMIEHDATIEERDRELIGDAGFAKLSITNPEVVDTLNRHFLISQKKSRVWAEVAREVAITEEQIKAAERFLSVLESPAERAVLQCFVRAARQIHAQ